MKSAMVAEVGFGSGPPSRRSVPRRATRESSMRFDVRHNIADVRRGLSNFAQAQVPFAASLALNAVAAKMADAEVRHLGEALDRPTPFTLRGVAVRRSTKRNLEAAVFVKDRQAEYLLFQEAGGTRFPASRAIPVAVKARRNSYGNLPRGGVKKLAVAANTFSGRPKGGGAPGLYRRLGVTADRKGGAKLELQVAWADRARYQPRIAFIETARRVAELAVAVEFGRAMEQAIRTARP